MGYHRAGFDVVGVDINPQPRYPFEFHKLDAMELLERMANRRFSAVALGVDAIHASPPCQAYSTATASPGKHPDLYEPTRRLLQATGLPWAIENVMGAPYQYGVRLCGTMFGLETAGEWLRRHRNFETSHAILQDRVCRHRKDVRAVTITGKCYLTVTKDCARHSRQPTFALAQELMGVDWMTRAELAQAIPPAYTEYIGRQLLDHLKAGAA